uniref:Uncharacterized protein n=1 Tax=Opuntia streptacantha TaxID=393608 RepID=A0A7C9CTQ7_OPUST
MPPCCPSATIMWVAFIFWARPHMKRTVHFSPRAKRCISRPKKDKKRLLGRTAVQAPMSVSPFFCSAQARKAMQIPHLQPHTLVSTPMGSFSLDWNVIHQFRKYLS